MTSRRFAVGLCAGAVVLLAGCADLLDPNSPPNIAVRQKVSSGFTGCEPADNVISQNTGDSWHATCQAKTYLCTDVSSSARSATFACAAKPQ